MESINTLRINGAACKNAKQKKDKIFKDVDGGPERERGGGDTTGGYGYPLHIMLITKNISGGNG